MDNVLAQLKDVKNRLSVMEQSVNRVDSEKKSNLNSIDDKIDTFRQGMTDVSSRMEAMEGAMKNSLTPMMQTMRSLSDAVKSLKENKQPLSESGDTDDLAK
jgi:septal ring factor EnvC (AmiA/AmiB activator)